jgi:hypothetical protein
MRCFLLHTWSTGDSTLGVVKICAGIRHANDAALAIRQLQQHLVRQLGDINGFPDRRRRGRRT